jgi:signal transduction histidine kinase
MSTERQMKNLVDQLPGPTILATRRGKLITVNPAARRLMGAVDWRMARTDLPTLWDVLNWPPVPFHRWQWNGMTLSVWDCPLDPDESEAQLVLRHIKPEVISDGTWTPRLKRQLLLGEHVGRIVHDLRNPLTSLEWLATLLGGECGTPQERQDLAGHLVKAVRSLNGLVSNLLVYAKPMSLEAGRVQVSTLFDEIEWMAVQPIRQKRISIRRQVEPGAEILWGDSTLLQQALLNVLLNAIHASSQDGGIEMVCRQVKDDPQRGKSREHPARIRIEVRDAGCGIAQDDMRHIFDPFFSKRKGGTGLGLSIVKQIVEAHHGVIEVVSQCGKGTTVSLSFP